MHPEVYILIIPAFGVVSHVVSQFSGKAVFGNFDAEGTVTLNNTNNLPQLTISVTNKHYSDVQPYMDTFGGDIYFNSSQNGYYKWTVQSRVDVLAMLGYFKQCSPHSFKKQRLILMSCFYQLYDLRAFIPESIHHSA